MLKGSKVIARDRGYYEEVLRIGVLIRNNKSMKQYDNKGKLIEGTDIIKRYSQKQGMLIENEKGGWVKHEDVVSNFKEKEADAMLFLRKESLEIKNGNSSIIVKTKTLAKWLIKFGGIE